MNFHNKKKKICFIYFFLTKLKKKKKKKIKHGARGVYKSSRDAIRRHAEKSSSPGTNFKSCIYLYLIKFRFFLIFFYLLVFL